MAYRPVRQIRLGRIRASIWAETSHEGIRHNLTFTQLCKVGRRRQNTSTFRCDDLSLNRQISDLAQQRILQQHHGMI